MHRSAISATRPARWVLFVFGFVVVSAAVPSSAVFAERLGAKLKLEQTRFRAGHEVRLQGVRFDRRAEVQFRITGMAGSCKEDEIVAEHTIESNKGGDIDLVVYQVQWDDCGWYQITAGQANRDARPVEFKVNGPGESPAEPDDGGPPSS